jgi:hypothetical protein
MPERVIADARFVDCSTRPALAARECQYLIG